MKSPTRKVILGLRKLINLLEEIVPMKGMTVGITVEEQKIANIDRKDFPPGTERGSRMNYGAPYGP